MIPETNPGSEYTSRRTGRRRSRPTRSLRKKPIPGGVTGVGGLVVVLMLCVTFLVRQMQVREMEKYIETLEKQVEYYTEANEGLRRQIEILQSDEYIEKVAREQLGLVKPGEIPYILTEPAPSGLDRLSGSQPGGLTRK